MGKHRKLRSKKAGLPPGSLIHIGEVKTQAPVLSLIAYGPDAFVEQELPDLAAFDRYSEGLPVRWLNVHGIHDASLLSEIGKQFDLHPLVIEDILNTDQRTKVDTYDGYLYVVARVYDVARARDDLATDQISLVVGRDFILSFQERRTGTFEPIRQRLRAERSPMRGEALDYLGYALLDTLVDAYFSIIERLGDQCEELEEEILGRPRKDVLQKAHQLKRELSQLRRTIWPLREVIGTLQRSPTWFFSDETRIYLRDIYDHTVHLLEQLEDLRDLLTGLLDIHLSSVSNRVNMEVRTLTLLTTVFMPAALIAAIFGMNFKVMPWLEQANGFWMALGLMACIALPLFLIFWSRRLLR